MIEIVPFDADHVYVRAHLEFYNGHSCGISGMARYENGHFVHHDPKPPLLQGDLPCVLRVGIGMDKRRRIRYMDRRKASRQYRQAIDDLRKTER